MDDEMGDEGCPADASRQPNPSTTPSAGSGPPPSAGIPPNESVRRSLEARSAHDGAELRISPNKNRLLQVRRAGSRKLFDKARKEVFLEWLAATCNVVLSSEMAGICDKTVYKHLLKDEAFVEAFVRALRVGYLRLEAREMQEAHRPPLPAHPQSADESPSPSRGEGQYEIGILDDDLAEEHFDPQLALQLLREHRRHLPGSSEKRPAQRTTAESATAKEVAEALAKRLNGFALRMGRDKHRD